jgi:putative DNA primase/helicase
MLWNEAQPILNTPVQAYLKARGLIVSACEVLRFHPHLKHTPSSSHLPAMLAKVTDISGNFVGLHRTFLDLANNSKASVTPNKMMLGNCGGGSVHFKNNDEKCSVIAVTEGIETALSVYHATGIETWACLSTSGMSNVQLPTQLKTLIICTDNDSPGVKASEALFTRAIAQRIAVKQVIPPHRGQDFNDVLKEDMQP